MTKRGAPAPLTILAHTLANSHADRSRSRHNGEGDVGGPGGSAARVYAVPLVSPELFQLRVLDPEPAETVPTAARLTAASAAARTGDR